VLEKGRFELVHLRDIRFGFRGNVAWLLIPPLLARINTEENLLRTEFGDEINAYCSHTSRLMPGIQQSNRPRKISQPSHHLVIRVLHSMYYARSVFLAEEKAARGT
jgi:hypothetical protein